MMIYNAGFEKDIRELSERLEKCDDTEEIIQELTGAVEKTDNLMHALDAKDAVLRAKTQIWAYKQIIDGYEQIFGTPADRPENYPANLPKLVEDIENESKNVGGGHINLGNTLQKIAEKMYNCTLEENIEEASNLYDKLILLSAKIIEATSHEVDELEEALAQENEAEDTLIQELG